MLNYSQIQTKNKIYKVIKKTELGYDRKIKKVVILEGKEKSDKKGRSRLNKTNQRDPFTTRTSKKEEEESDSQTNGSPICNDSPPITAPRSPAPSPTTSPTTKTNILLIGLAYVIVFILCGIVFCEYIFGDIFVNQILNENVKCEFGNLNNGYDYGLYRPTPEPTDTPPPTTIDLIN